MKIPKKLKIGNHSYSVVFSRPRDADKGSGNWGACDHSNQKIYIDKLLPKTLLEEVFIHEMLHAVMHEVKLNYDFDSEEKKVSEEDVVNRVAPALLKALRDNNLIK